MREHKTWEIRSIHHPVMTVLAPDWLAALGAALSELGIEDGLNRLACERLASGLIIANDVGRKVRFTVRDVTRRPAAPLRSRPRPKRSRAPHSRKTPPGSVPSVSRGVPSLDWMLEGLHSIH
jgi:hypothetical protein